MARSARSGARHAPAARAALAAASAAVAATVLVGLGHAQGDPQVEPAPQPSPVAPALPAVPMTSAPLAPPQATSARPTPTASNDSEPAAREQVRAAAPRPAPPQPTAHSGSPPPSTPAAPPAEPVPQARPERVAGTPCTATARACVDLDERMAWLIEGATVVRGPVPVQHGDPTDPTPRGRFEVQWKAAEYTSRQYLRQMPYSVFFADGGIAFHEGGQDTPSAGCVKLGREDAQAWFAFLQVGDEVQIH